jgi:hypothetical protein
MMEALSIRLMIFSGREQRRQSRGSASYTFLINRAQVRLLGLAQPFRVSEAGAERAGGEPVFRARARRTWDHPP